MNKSSDVEFPDGEVGDTVTAPRRKPPTRVWTREKIVVAIRELGEQGIDLSPTAIQKTHSALFSSARSRSHFGTWRSAVVAAGFDYEEIKRVQQRWSRDGILEEIRACHSRGEDLLHPDFKLRYRSLYLAACAHRYFGSWRRAVAAAGLDHETMREGRVWTKARIQRTIRELAEQGHSLSWSSVEEMCPGIYRAARRRENFGSWQGALQAAGVTATPKRRGRRAGSGLAKAQQAQVAALTQIADAELDAPQSPRVPGAKPALEDSLTLDSTRRELSRR